MKQESIQDCKIELVYLKNERAHFHQDFELIYIVENEVHVKEEEDCILGEGDFAVLNSHQLHAFECSGHTIAFRILLPYRVLKNLICEDGIVFQCNSVRFSSKEDNELKLLMQKLILLYLGEEKDQSGMASLLFQIIHLLSEYYRMKDQELKQFLKTHMNEKIDRILDYMNHHYYESLTLTDVAEHFHVSETYLSRYFKTKTGKNFVNYLNEVRVENAALELRKTDASITNVAVNNGFSTPSVLNRYFKQKYGITPSEYRKKEQEVFCADMIEQEKVEEVRHNLSEHLEKKATDHQIKKIVVRDHKSNMKWMNRSTIVNVGEASMVLGATIQEHLLFLEKTLDIQYIRIWNLFSEDFMISKDFSGDSFNFELLDRIFDFFVQHKISLFLDLGKRNRIIMAGRGNELYSSNQQYQLRNLSEWKNLLEHLLKHLVRRYDKHVLDGWIFEFPWNKEPYYEEDYNYIDAYEAGYRTVKTYLHSRVAAMSPHGGIDEISFRKMVREMKHREIFPDIVTLKIFVDYTHQMMGERVYQNDSGYLYARQFIEKVHCILAEENMPPALLGISEWSNSVSNRNILQDSCARATYIIKFILSIWKLVDMIGFWHCSDAVDTFYDSKKLIYGGGGLLTKDGIKKPSFYAFEFLDKLGRDILKIGNNYIITKDSSHTIICLCFNHREYSYYYYLKKEYEHLDLSKVFLSEEKEFVEFSIGGLRDQTDYMIKEEVVNANNGSIQDEWKLLGNQEELGKEDIQYLKNICIPKMYIRHTESGEQRINFQVELEPHEIRIIYINEY